MLCLPGGELVAHLVALRVLPPVALTGPRRFPLAGTQCYHFSLEGLLRAGAMGRWTGETIPMPIGTCWTYKLRLLAPAGGQPTLVLADKTFATRQEAQAAGEAHLQAELEKRSG